MVNSIVLIGMPGSGKSTLGVLLAKELAKSFVDTDIELQAQIGCCLQTYLDQHGYLLLREQEEICLKSHRIENSVIATGGSAVYSSEGMASIKRGATCVYLKLSLPEVFNRVKNFSSRGIAAAPGKSLDAIFEERQTLYERHADITLDMAGLDVESSLASLLDVLN